MVAVEVHSANRSPWHSSIRFSISPRTTGLLVAEAEQHRRIAMPIGAQSLDFFDLGAVGLQPLIHVV
jgi:hypothetical protein